MIYVYIVCVFMCVYTGINIISEDIIETWRWQSLCSVDSHVVTVYTYKLYSRLTIVPLLKIFFKSICMLCACVRASVDIAINIFSEDSIEMWNRQSLHSVYSHECVVCVGGWLCAGRCNRVRVRQWCYLPIPASKLIYFDVIPYSY